MKLRRAVGIDLGTTNSAIALLAPDGSEIWLHEDRFKRKTYPSMVGLDPASEELISGWEAFNRRALDPQPLASIKRKMGRQQTVQLGHHALLPEEVSAVILEHMRAQMLEWLPSRSEDDQILVHQAAITVPAYFDAPQIEATRRAGELAGLEVISLLQEPTAAAMYYAWKHQIGDGTFMVYDLGGGTFDVSVIRCLMGEYQVLGIDGDNYLGGDDFDRKLAEHIRHHLVAQGYALDLDILHSADDLRRFTLLQRLAQEVKEALSTSPFQYVGRRDLFEDQQGQPVTVEMEMGREDFEALISPLVEQSLEACQRAIDKAIEAAGIQATDIDHVLLVGGSTRVPLVQDKVAQAFCQGQTSATRPLLDEPDTCVALGAAIHAANVGGLTVIEEEHPSSRPPAQLQLSTPLSSTSAQARLLGRLTTEASVIDQVASVALLTPSGDVEAVVRPEEYDQASATVLFAFEQIHLPDPGLYPFALEFCDDEGQALASLQVRLRRLSEGEALRPTGSALSNPSVLAKDIYLEVVRDGRADRQVLLRNGTSLPAEGRFRFYTADRSGAVILRLFQNRFPIRTIHLDVPKETETGTPVDLHLQVDEAMTIVASGELLGQTFWAQIEPPPPRELKGWEEIEALLDRCEGIERQLWGYEARWFNERTSTLRAGIREAARTDPDKLQVLVSRLEDTLAEYHERDQELTPGYGRYVMLLDAVRRIVYRDDAYERHLGLNPAEWRERLTSIEQTAERAYADRDQRAWSQAFNQVQAIFESLAQDEARFDKGDPAEQVRRIHEAVVERYNEMQAEMAGMTLASNPETRSLQEAELARLQQELAAKAGQPLGAIDLDRLSPPQAKAELDRIYETMSYIKRQLERLPTLGLVRQ